MKLLVSTPTSIVVEGDDVSYVRAEDETGAFGILPRHADFVTVLSISVISWRDGQDKDHHIAVRGGVMTVRDGTLVEVATRQAISEDTLRELGVAVLDRFREEVLAEEEARVSAARLHVAAIRQIQRYLRPDRQPMRYASFGGQRLSPRGVAGDE